MCSFNKIGINHLLFIIHTILGYGTRPNEYISHNNTPKLHMSDLLVKA